MSPIITAVLVLLQTIAPSLGSTTAIGAVINALLEIVPVLIKEYQDVLPMVKNIIAALQGNTAIDPSQIAQLKALDAQVDAAFDQAAQDAEAEDAAAGSPGTT